MVIKVNPESRSIDFVGTRPSISMAKVLLLAQLEYIDKQIEIENNEKEAREKLNAMRKQYGINNSNQAKNTARPKSNEHESRGNYSLDEAQSNVTIVTMTSSTNANGSIPHDLNTARGNSGRGNNQQSATDVVDSLVRAAMTSHAGNRARSTADKDAQLSNSFTHNEPASVYANRHSNDRGGFNSIQAAENLSSDKAFLSNEDDALNSLISHNADSERVLSKASEKNEKGNSKHTKENKRSKGKDSLLSIVENNIDTSKSPVNKTQSTQDTKNFSNKRNDKNAQLEKEPSPNSKMNSPSFKKLIPFDFTYPAEATTKNNALGESFSMSPLEPDNSGQGQAHSSQQSNKRQQANNANKKPQKDKKSTDPPTKSNGTEKPKANSGRVVTVAKANEGSESPNLPPAPLLVIPPSPPKGASTATTSSSSTSDKKENKDKKKRGNNSSNNKKNDSVAAVITTDSNALDNRDKGSQSLPCNHEPILMKIAHPFQSAKGAISDLVITEPVTPPRTSSGPPKQAPSNLTSLPTGNIEPVKGAPVKDNTESPVDAVSNNNIRRNNSKGKKDFADLVKKVEIISVVTPDEQLAHTLAHMKIEPSMANTPATAVVITSNKEKPLSSNDRVNARGGSGKRREEGGDSLLTQSGIETSADALGQTQQSKAQPESAPQSNKRTGKSSRGPQASSGDSLLTLETRSLSGESSSNISKNSPSDPAASGAFNSINNNKLTLPPPPGIMTTTSPGKPDTIKSTDK